MVEQSTISFRLKFESWTVNKGNAFHLIKVEENSSGMSFHIEDRYSNILKLYEIAK